LDAIVTGVADYGFFGQPEKLPVEGLVHISTLPDDYYRYDESSHTLIGQRILGAAPPLRPIGAIVRSTHENWDGGGYPDALAGEAIPLAARIVSVCDAYAAMTSDRPYSAARTPDEAVAELRRCAGQQFDPRVVELLCLVLEDEDEAAPALAAGA